MSILINKYKQLRNTYGSRWPLYFVIRRPWGNLISDRSYLKIDYFLNLGKKLNLNNPVTFNEKMQWLKLYNRNPIYTTMADKLEVKNYITEKIGDRYVIKLLGSWDTFDEIDFDLLPEKFVLKTTHGCGGMVICKNKGDLDVEKARKIINKSLKADYFYQGREWPYKNIKKRILAEEYMQDGDSENLTVYKIFNLSGIPTIIQVIQDDKTAKETIDYFDTEWNLLDLKQNFPNSPNHLPKPRTLDDMLELARKLSEGMPFIRTDFYEINGEVYFSEFTFFSDDGFAEFHPGEWDEKLGEKIDLKLSYRP